jgi:hypothetical protein
MDRLRIVELIEDYSARLSPEGRELWESLERLIEISPPGDDIESEMWERAQGSLDLPPGDHVVWAVLGALFLGLQASDLAESRWGVQVADKVRRRFVIKAAQERARVEGRTVTPEPEMTVEEALALLAEDYSPNVGE